MSGRDAVFAKVRRSLGVSADDAARKRAVESRLAEPKPNTIPARGQLDRAGRVALFKEMAERVSATVERLASADDVPAAVAPLSAGPQYPLAASHRLRPGDSRPALGARAAS